MGRFLRFAENLAISRGPYAVGHGSGGRVYRPAARGHGSVSEIRRGFSRLPEDPAQPAADPRGRISPLAAQASFSPNSGGSREIRVNGANPPSGRHGSVSENRREMSRLPEDPTQSATDPVGRIYHPPRATQASFSPNSGRSREIRVNGANPPRGRHGSVSEIRREISRSPEDPMQSATDPGGRIFRPPRHVGPVFPDFRQAPRNHSKWRKPTAKAT